MSYVAMAKKICPICLVEHEHNTELLLNKKLEDIPEDQRVTGWGLCDPHDFMYEEGLIALVEVIEGTENGRTELNQSDANRTGNLAHINPEALGINIEGPMAFVNQETFERIRLMAEGPKH
jgi:hypothetical protein